MRFNFFSKKRKTEIMSMKKIGNQREIKGNESRKLITNINAKLTAEK
jgi:hypothetical protein